MSPSPLPPSSAAEEQAALWAAKLDGSVLSARDQAALKTWLATDPSHAGLLNQYCQFSADLEQVLPVLVSAGALTPLSVPAVSRQRLRLLAGTLLAAAAALAFALWFSVPGRPAVTVAATTSQRQTLTLADGSHIDLNAHTDLTVELTQAARHVRLADGQAFFAVSKDPTRPFTVDTPAGAVLVTGTSFDVRTIDGASLEVTVLEGSVKVTPLTRTESVALKAGDQLTAAHGQFSLKTLSPTAVENALAWRRGQIVFAEGTPLQEALERFSRHHRRFFHADADVARLRIGGRFSLDDPASFFTALQEILPVSVQSSSDGSVHVSARPTL